MICSDSRSALDCLRLPTDGERSDITCVRSGLSHLNREVVLQWVPGHCGLPGNEMADHEAKAAASVGTPVVDESLDELIVEDVSREIVTAGHELSENVEPLMGDDVGGFGDCWVGDWRERVRFVGVERQGLSYDGVKSRIRREVFDPPPVHPRVRAVYCAETAAGPGPPARVAAHVFDSLCFTRGEGVLLAQLRTGHSPSLAAYRALCSPGSSADCLSCLQAPQTVEHWLQDCDALAPLRMRILGAAAPPLSVMTSDPVAVVAYARASLRRP